MTAVPAAPVPAQPGPSRLPPHLPFITARAAGPHPASSRWRALAAGDIPTGRLRGHGGLRGQAPFRNGSGSESSPVPQVAGERWRGEEEAPGGCAAFIGGSWGPVSPRSRQCSSQSSRNLERHLAAFLRLAASGGRDFMQMQVENLSRQWLAVDKALTPGPRYLLWPSQV